MSSKYFANIVENYANNILESYANKVQIMFKYGANILQIMCKIEIVQTLCKCLETIMQNLYEHQANTNQHLCKDCAYLSSL